MRELRAEGPAIRGEARLLGQVVLEGGDPSSLPELSQGIGIAVRSWRERGGGRWISIQLPQAFKLDDRNGHELLEVEVFIPLEVFTQRHGQEVPGPNRAYVTR